MREVEAMTSGDVFFPWDGEPATMVQAIREAESGALGDVDEVVTLWEGEERRITLAQAKARLTESQNVAPFKERTNDLMHKRLDVGLTEEEERQQANDLRVMHAYDSAEPPGGGQGSQG
jgi:hypothetical protein